MTWVLAGNGQSADPDFYKSCFMELVDVGAQWRCFRHCFYKGYGCRYLAIVAYQSTMMLAQSPHPSPTGKLDELSSAGSTIRCERRWWRRPWMPVLSTPRFKAGPLPPVGWVATWRWPMRWLEGELISDLNSTPLPSHSVGGLGVMRNITQASWDALGLYTIAVSLQHRKETLCNVSQLGPTVVLGHIWTWTSKRRRSY